MPKNLVFCADGTWDDPNTNSNVCQLYTALENLPGVQVPMYDSGVGSDGTPVDKLLGGAVGAGLFQKIKDGYSAISAQYESGDQIFIFGFSRGAYTARSLAGMIAICGLPTVNQQDPQCLDMAFEAYRNAAQRDVLLDTLNTDYKMDNATIQLLGVWDTVGSLGIPALFGSIDVIQYGFLSTTLHEDVQTAVQALSIDEQRMQFQPAVFGPSTYPEQTLVQVWFSGVHCDVGGGYSPDQNGASLSNIPLLWMASYAKAAGLQFTPEGSRTRCWRSMRRLRCTTPAPAVSHLPGPYPQHSADSCLAGSVTSAAATRTPVTLRRTCTSSPASSPPSTPWWM